MSKINLNVGEHFTYKGIEFICLDFINDNILAITAQLIGEMEFDKNNIGDWRKSSLRKELNEEFIKKLDKKHLIPITLDLTADNGDTTYGTCEDYVGIVSCDQYRKYRKYIPLFEEWMWTCTPWDSTPNSGNANGVRIVNGYGRLYCNNAINSYGVAPLVMFASEHLTSHRQVQLVGVDEE